MTSPADAIAPPTLDDALARLGDPSLRALFAADPGRAARCSVEACGMVLDYSRQRVDAGVMDALERHAHQRGVGDAVARQMRGEIVNPTEHRPALHTALRAPADADVRVAGYNVVPAIDAVRQRLAAFATRVRSGAWTGHTGQPITDVVNIGIGGSDLGPRMVVEALRPFHDGPRTHFVANVDPDEMLDALARIKAETTLFVIVSKTFTTQETMANAGLARAWFLQNGGGEADIARHFVAVSTNLEAVAAFGIAPDNAFGFWDWVGGRYSLWSAVGLSIALACGPDSFTELLAGAHAMDVHAASAPFTENMPQVMAALVIANQRQGAASHVVAPYSQRLGLFVDWLQQLEMESNGKRVTTDGEPVRAATPALWGAIGTNAQHAFFQLLHQGPDVHPVDFIAPVPPPPPTDDPLAALVSRQQRLLLANALAQARALAWGKTADEVRDELTAKGLQGAALAAAVPHRVFPGNRPSSLLLMPAVAPWSLGALLALYEQRTVALAAFWGLNPFDQWGVELGKQMAGPAEQALAGGGADSVTDPATARAAARVRSLRGDTAVSPAPTPAAG